MFIILVIKVLSIMKLLFDARTLLIVIEKYVLFNSFRHKETEEGYNS